MASRSSACRNAYALLAVGHQQLVRDRLPDRLLVLRLGQPGRLPDQLVVHPPAGDGGRPQHLLGRGRQPLGPGQQQVGEPGRAARCPHADAGEQLLGVVGVALGPADQAVQHRRRPAAAPDSVVRCSAMAAELQRPERRPR